MKLTRRIQTRIDERRYRHISQLVDSVLGCTDWQHYALDSMSANIDGELVRVHVSLDSTTILFDARRFELRPSDAIAVNMHVIRCSVHTAHRNRIFAEVARSMNSRL